MKMTASFNSFMTNTVNINQTRLDQLDTSTEGIFKAAKADSEIGSIVADYDKQGSLLHQTIIKPADNVEFDADIMLIMKEQADWAKNPRKYNRELRAAFARHGTYSSMVQPAKCRCVRIAYAGDYHVDVVPYVKLSDGRLVIVNADDNVWEDTNPAGFTSWMKDKNAVTGGNLKKAIRLFKYLRDHQDNFKLTRSVLLTVMLGERVRAANKIFDPAYYEDLSTTFFHLITDLNTWLQANPTKPSIPDPSGAKDPFGVPVTFDHRWTEATYQSLRDRIATLAATTKSAYEDTTSIEHSLKLWQKVFGSDFVLPPSSRSSVIGQSAVVAPGLSQVTSGRGG